MELLGKIRKLVYGSKEVLIMVVVQLVYAGSNITYKLAASDGMSVRIIVAYRYIFATIFMIPLALFFERASLSQNLYAESLVLTSATFASAMANLLPAVTFILSILFGLEKVGLRTMAGKAKVMGTTIGIGGAMLLTFYRGSEINIFRTHIDLMKHYQPQGSQIASSLSPASRALGCALALASCSSFALWLIVQAQMSRSYPLPYSSSALMALMASIQSTVYALFMEKDWSAWKLGWNIRLFTAAYTGILAAGTMNALTICILGAALIVSGLYAVLWGKNIETKTIAQLFPLETSHEVERLELQVISSHTNDNCKNDQRVETQQVQ
ncbi:hypothetical protein GH714_038425 [Hevea brasiliensis]|uniref:WAT1-related protein n=1 Tax=Hevea brasiliensis TaxID=3981 RepID=A0A6A6NAL4_HEVBR|nr:hypothetical protein GH714_038425 [Hevea brasiliensis]